MHGTFKGDPPRGDPPRRDPSDGWGAGLSLVLRILLREATFGSLLYVATGIDPKSNAIACVAVWVGLMLLTLKRGLLNRRGGAGLLIECLAIFCGALVFRNLLVLLPTLLAGGH